MSETTSLRLLGRDALSLLHRISTNALADLTPGRARATLFCDFRGRLLHRALVGIASDGAVWLFRDDAPGAPLAAFLARLVFRDDVRIEDHSAELAVLRAAPAPRLAPDALDERGGVPVAVRAGEDDALVVGGGSDSTSVADRDERNRARVRAGRTAHGHEIV
jgi:folate-binding Fe-S cluster repair protein YgfZ